MKLATLRNGSRDGQLVVVSRNMTRYLPAPTDWPDLQTALEEWDRATDALTSVATKVEDGAGAAFDPADCAAPLPRAYGWVDGSVFTTHTRLMAIAGNRDYKEPERPLMYQGASDHMLGATEDIVLPADRDLGVDFEAEIGVILDDTPMGVAPADALAHVKLLTVINDVSLRALSRAEMSTGFGWIQAKPASSFAPVVVTPDELGASWANGRLSLDVNIHWNGEWFGNPNGREMAFGFDEIIAYAAGTRRLTAGTIIGSGTVSSPDYATVGSACIAERRTIETIDKGAPQTGFMQFGDVVEIDVMDAAGQSIFGAIRQRVAAAA